MNFFFLQNDKRQLIQHLVTGAYNHIRHRHWNGKAKSSDRWKLYESGNATQNDLLSTRKEHINSSHEAAMLRTGEGRICRTARRSMVC